MSNWEVGASEKNRFPAGLHVLSPTYSRVIVWGCKATLQFQFWKQPPDRSDILPQDTNVDEVYPGYVIMFPQKVSPVYSAADAEWEEMFTYPGARWKYFDKDHPTVTISGYESLNHMIPQDPFQTTEALDVDTQMPGHTSGLATPNFAWYWEVHVVPLSGMRSGGGPITGVDHYFSLNAHCRYYMECYDTRSNNQSFSEMSTTSFSVPGT